MKANILSFFFVILLYVFSNTFALVRVPLKKSSFVETHTKISTKADNVSDSTATSAINVKIFFNQHRILLLLLIAKLKKLKTLVH